MNCTNCGKELAEGIKFCPECGTPVPKNKFCISCGTKLEPDAKFCPECGTKVGGAVASSAAVEEKSAIDYDKLDSMTIDELMALEEKTHDAMVQFKIGDLYQFVHPGDEEGTFSWVKKAADQGLPEALNELGLYYETGNGVEEDLGKALESYREAYKRGCKNAYSIGTLLYDNAGSFGNEEEDYKEAVEMFMTQPEDGSSRNKLGVCYYFGRGIEKSYDKAFECFKYAAEHEISDAYSWLGLCYQNGKGTEKNIVSGVKWFKKGAEDDDSYCQFKLAGFYADKEDFKNAFIWYEKAANNGDNDALRELGILYNNGDGVEKDLDKAFDCFLKAGEDTDDVPYWLGRAYFLGRGTDVDYDEALRLFKLGSENQDDSYCQINIARMYRDGTGVEQNIEKAKEWYKKSIDNGNEKAEKELSEL
ncbi:MAG: zinc-ribbon domain-containing protein [Treponema sp.]|nr:zinc-ribbon domain-containing protein [Treponema sp.]